MSIRWLAIGVLAVTVGSGQTVLTDPKKIAEAQKLVDTLRGDELRCEVLPVKPHFLFSLRLQAGYVAYVPTAQVQGQKWIVLTRVASKEGNGNPVYLSDVQSPGGDGGPTKVEGAWWLGEGRYSVRFLMFDGRGEVCRKEWQIDARLNPGVRNVNPVLAPGTVDGLPLNGDARAEGAKPLDRVTILLHAAAVLQMQTLLSPLDKAMLLDGLVALMGELPAGSVRLVVFNLEQQQEILRKDVFRLEALPEVAQALDRVQPATVSFSAAQNPDTAVNFIENLVNQEMRASEPSGAVVFLGPRSIYKSKPSPSFGLPRGAKQQFFYLVCEPAGILRSSARPRSAAGWEARGWEMGIPPPARGGAPMQPDYPDSPSSNYGPNHGSDSIEYAVGQLGGKTMKVDSVVSFADAVAEIARRSGAKR